MNFEVNVGDIAGLQRLLKESGAHDSDIELLTDALEQDPQPIDGKSFGPRVTAAIGKLVSKAADGSWNVG